MQGGRWGSEEEWASKENVSTTFLPHRHYLFDPGILLFRFKGHYYVNIRRLWSWPHQSAAVSFDLCRSYNIFLLDFHLLLLFFYYYNNNNNYNVWLFCFSRGLSCCCCWCCNNSNSSSRRSSCSIIVVAAAEYQNDDVNYDCVLLQPYNDV